MGENILHPGYGSQGGASGSAMGGLASGLGEDCPLQAGGHVPCIWGPQITDPVCFFLFYIFLFHETRSFYVAQADLLALASRVLQL